MNWTTDRPKISAYYWALPVDKDDWLDSAPEVVYVYFDGKWSVIRSGIAKNAKFEEFSHWCGPITQPELDEDETLQTP